MNIYIITNLLYCSILSNGYTALTLTDSKENISYIKIHLKKIIIYIKTVELREIVSIGIKMEEKLSTRLCRCHQMTVRIKNYVALKNTVNFKTEHSGRAFKELCISYRSNT